MGKPICGTVAFSIAKNNPAFTGLSVYRTLSGGRRLAYYVGLHTRHESPISREQTKLRTAVGVGRGRETGGRASAAVRVARIEGIGWVLGKMLRNRVGRQINGSEGLRIPWRDMAYESFERYWIPRPSTTVEED